ncbi:MAG: ion transporter [Cyanobacteria bacterium CRU_2_1]|nr:ion transporter [Cyanobacteria bacterium RU_5_0]NJR59535.1 ion transporter [Cyanobacteria bacterium CRU_2_1]
MKRAVDREIPYLLFIVGLSILSLLTLAVNATIELDSATKIILHYADTAICVVFFLDFLHCLAWSDNKKRYLLTWGWLDLLSSIPLIEAFRWGRMARLFRLIQILRGVRATRILMSFVMTRRTQNTMMAVVLLTIILIVCSSIAILHVEQGEGVTIHEPSDALWWAITTITTAGYGDTYPVTLEGRVIASLLMIAGVGLFGTLSGFIAAWLLESHEEKQEHDIHALVNEVQQMRQQLEQLTATLKDVSDMAITVRNRTHEP